MMPKTIDKDNGDYDPIDDEDDTPTSGGDGICSIS